MRYYRITIEPLDGEAGRPTGSKDCDAEGENVSSARWPMSWTASTRTRASCCQEDSVSSRPGALALHSCWRCSAHLAGEPGVVQALRRAGAAAYCARCQVIADAEQAALPCLPGRRCVHVKYQSGPFAELVIEEVKDGQVKVFVLGFPDRPGLAWPFWPAVMRGRTMFARGELLMKGL